MKKIRIIDFYVISLLITGICAIILRTNALLSVFDSLTLQFTDKTLITVASIILAAAVIGFFAYLFIGDKERNLIAKSGNAATYIPAGIVCTSLMFMVVERFTDTNASYSSPLLGWLSIISAILAVLSVGAFFLSIFIEKNDNLYKASFSLCIVFFLALYAAYLFFNKEVHPTNSPNKLVDQMAYLFSAVFFLFETRIYLGRTKWRPYVASGLAATLLCAYSAIPSLIIYFANGYTVSDSIIESVLTLTLSVYICSRVLQTRSLGSAEECSAAKSIAALALSREEEIEEHRKLSRAQEPNNMEENNVAKDAANYTFDIPYTDTITDFNPEGADVEINQNYSD